MEIKKEAGILPKSKEIRSPDLTKSLREIHGGTKKHVKYHHQDASSTIQHTKNSTGQMTQFFPINYKEKKKKKEILLKGT